MKINYFQQGGANIPSRTKINAPISLQKPAQGSVSTVTPPAFIREFALASQNPEAKAAYDDVQTRSAVTGKADALALRLNVMPMNNGQRMFKSSLNEQYWLGEANKYGNFKNIQEVIDWQKANGLVADGKFGKNSIAKWNTLNPKPAPAPAPVAPAQTEPSNHDALLMLALDLKRLNEINGATKLETQAAKDAAWAAKPLLHANNFISAPTAETRYTGMPLRTFFNKEGGRFKFQAGGQMQQDPIAEVISGLIQNPQQTIQALSQSKDANAIVQEIVKRAKAGDQQAAQAVQVLQQIMQLQQAPAAKNGAKLDYFRRLRGKCPQGEEMVYMKNGGCMCQKKVDGGKQEAPQKKQFFTKKPLDKCGGKMKKKK